MKILFKRVANKAFRKLPQGRRLLDRMEDLDRSNVALAIANDDLVRCIENGNHVNEKLTSENTTLISKLEKTTQANIDLGAANTSLSEEKQRLEGEIESIANELRLLNHEYANFRAETADELKKYGDVRPFVPNGHFYSPVHSRIELAKDLARIYSPTARVLAGIDLKEREQLDLLEELSTYCRDVPLESKPKDGRRYGYENTAYGAGDAVILHGMLRHTKPQRVIEVGSGYSSCMTLDTNEFWFNNSIDCTFIEPYPELLYSLLKPDDLERIKILPVRVQDVDFSVFSALKKNDILFIDSTHVSKVGSDVNRLFFEILPLLAEGVLIHIHDIFYPFEYPKSWLEEGRAWNELYLLRALLQDTHAYEILLFNNFLWECKPDEFLRAVPAASINSGGSIWLKKRRVFD